MYRKTKDYKELNPLNFKGFKIWIYYKIIPTRSRKRNLKQICLWDLARIIYIAFIIQTSRAI